MHVCVAWGDAMHLLHRVWEVQGGRFSNLDLQVTQAAVRR